VNAGVITGGDGGGAGVSAGNGNITNSGRIAGGGSSDTGGDGIVLSRSGVVTNSGTVTGGAGRPGLYGNGEGGSGIVLGMGTISNRGTIAAGAGYSSYPNHYSLRGGVGVELVSAGTIRNGSARDKAALISGNYAGVFIDTSASRPTVTNFGTIAATNTVGSGIVLDSRSTVTIENAGTISGADGVAIVASGGAGLKLIVDKGAAFDGIVNAAGGINEIDFARTGTIALAPEYLGFSIVRLADGGANGLSITPEDFIGLPASATLTVYGGNDANTIDASALTASEKVKLIGGGRHDLFEFSAAGLTNGDTILGGGYGEALLLTTAGKIAAGGVRGVGTFVLANGGANSLTLTDANFVNVAESTITIDGGNGGNRIDAAKLAAATHIVVHAGGGKDTLIGGAGRDVFYAGGATRMTGGARADEFAFAAAGHNVVTDFTAAQGDRLAFSNRGFRLGLTDATQTPNALPSALFVADPSGAFRTKTQRFAYDTTTGQLFYDSRGSAGPGSRELVVTLVGHPLLTAGHLFFIS
jgi:hypothetical protein